MTGGRVLGLALLAVGLTACAGEDPVKPAELDEALEGLAVVSHDLSCRTHELSKRCDVDVVIAADATSEEITAVAEALVEIAAEAKVKVSVALEDTELRGRIGRGAEASVVGPTFVLAREAQVGRLDADYGTTTTITATSPARGSAEVVAVQLADAADSSVTVVVGDTRYVAEPGDDLVDEAAVLRAALAFQVDGAEVRDGEVLIRFDDDVDLAAAEAALRAAPEYARVDKVEIGYDVKAGGARDERADELEVVEEALEGEAGLIGVTREDRFDFEAATPADGQRLDRLLRERAADVYAAAGSSWTLGTPERYISVIQPTGAGEDFALAIALWDQPVWDGATIVDSGTDFARIELYPTRAATPFDIGRAMATARVDEVGPPVTVNLPVSASAFENYEVTFNGASLALDGKVALPAATLQQLNDGWSNGVRTR